MTKKKLPAPQLVARRVAGLLVERLNLTPPVDVEAIIRAQAELHRVDWPFNHTDAILLGLGSSRKPRIFYRATQNPFRERFTLAHELGHLTLPWHLPQANCSIDETVETDAGLMGVGRYTTEDEADVFASCVLIPDRWLHDLVRDHGDDMTRILRELNEAEVTTQAALRGLRRVLLAGWAFTAYRSQTVIATPGTNVPWRDSIDVVEQLTESSVAHGSADLNGFPVQWFQLAETAVLASRADDDGRKVAQILKDALAETAPDEDIPRMVQVCNGKIGGSLREWAGRPAEETYSSLLYRFQNSELAQLLEISDFRLWLAEKARAVENGETKRRR